DGDTSSIAALQSNPGPDGRISLREAILAANATPNGGTPDTIDFNISGGGPFTIIPGSALPTITDAVVIDGSTSSGGPGGRPGVELNGAGGGATTNGLILAPGSAGSTIRGLVINRFGRYGILLYGDGGHRIVGNYIGTNVAGTAAAANGAAGVVVYASAN